MKLIKAIRKLVSLQTMFVCVTDQTQKPNTVISWQIGVVVAAAAVVFVVYFGLIKKQKLSTSYKYPYLCN